MNKFNLLLSSSISCCKKCWIITLHIYLSVVSAYWNMVPKWTVKWMNYQKKFICLLILQKYIVWKLKIKIHDKLFYFLFQISTEILLKVIGKHFCIYLLIHCFQFLKLYTTQVDIACLLALHLRVFGFFWNVVINNWVH